MTGDDNHDVDHPETSNTSPPVPPPTQQIHHTVSSIKLPILKKGKYNIWAMKIEHYLSHTGYPIWQVIHNVNGHVSVTTDINGMIKVLSPKTAEDAMAREIKRKARTTLLMALPEDHLAKFYKMADAKEMFQTLVSQLDIHGVGVSHEDANQKFLRSLHFFWSQVALIMRTKPGLDLSFDDLYNNLRVFERDVKGTTPSSSNTHYVAMISIRIKKFHKRTGRKLQFDTKDPVGLDKTKVECFNCHKMGHFTKDCRAKGNQATRRRDAGYKGNKPRDNGRRPAYQDDSKDLVTIDGEDIDWSHHVKEDTENYVMLAYSSSNSGSDNEVKSCSKACEEAFARHKKLYDEQRNKLVLALITGNSMPSGPDVEIDYSKFTYGLKQTSADESDSKPNEYASCESDSSVETPTSMPEPVENAPKVICEPKLWTDAPIIEEYESDSDNDSMYNVQKDKEKPSFTNFVKHVKTLRENIKETGTTTHSPKIEKQDRNAHTRKGLGYAFTRKACFVCGSFSHLIKACDFHVKRMAKQAELTKSKNKDDPHRALKDKGIFDSRCSRHMTRKKDYLADYQEFKSGSVAFGGSNGRIISKGKIKAGMVLVTKPQNKTPYELLTGKQPIISYLRPFGFHVTILNTINQLGKFDVKSDLGFLVGYSLNSKAFRELEKLKRQEKEANHAAESLRKETTHDIQNANTSSTNLLNIVSTLLSTAGPLRAFNNGELSFHDDPSMPHLEDIYASPSEGLFTDSSYDNECVVTDFNNLETTMNVSLTPTTRIHTIRPKTQILGDPMSIVQTRSKVNKNSEAHALISQALEDESWAKAMQEELPQFQIQKDERDIVVRNKARLVAQGHRQEEGIDYDEVFALMARIEAIRIFLDFSSYMGFIVYQMDVKSAFMYSTIDEEVYLSQPPCFVDPKFPNKKSWCNKFEDLMKNSTPIETQKPLVKDEEAADVDVSGYSKIFTSLRFEENL
nr:hypothetical protein [Tanacetum cinerariifolium]